MSKADKVKAIVETLLLLNHLQTMNLATIDMYLDYDLDRYKKLYLH